MSIKAATVANLKTENCVGPLGIDNPTPRFSWVIQDSKRGQLQTAYQIYVSSTQTGSGDVWNSGKVVSSKQTGVLYAGTALASRTTYWWKVKIWDNSGSESSLSDAAMFETGMLKQSDWTSSWIGGDFNLLRDDWVLNPAKTIAKSRLYVTSLGYNEVYINGKKVGDHVLDPAFTKYDKRALYSTYDVTNLMNAQNNAVGIMLGNAYYGNVDYPQDLPITSSYYSSGSLWVRMQMTVTYTDGTTTTFGTSTSTFKALKGGPVKYNHVFNGETYDARAEIAGWANYGFNDASWSTPSVFSYGGTINAQLLPIRVVETIVPKTVIQVKTGVFVYDMGLNMVGWVSLAVNGTAGQTVTLKFAEVTNADGTVNQTDLRSAKCTDHYTLKGDGAETWEPRFTYHGFRYVQVEGFPGTPTTASITGKVIRSDYANVNTFTCSNTLINSIYSMYSRSQRGNSTGIPTDCPQRDERQGWGADAMVTAEAALLSFDMIAFYEKWFNDIDDSQKGDGSIPCTVPDFHDVGDDVAWGSIRVLIPWDLYMATGDSYPLAQHYTRMKAYVNSLAGGPPASCGDWVPAGPTENEAYFAAAYYYQNANLMAKIAGVLGNTADQTTYANLADTLRNDFNTANLKNNSSYGGNNQSANAVPLQFDMVPSTAVPAVLTSLVSNVTSNTNHLTTGILGSKAIMEALWKNNRSDVAFKLMTQTTYPSWGYMFNKGPGTIWENWNSDQAIGSGMNSLNHVMYGGGPGTWVYKAVAGISAITPGYESIMIRPEVNGLTSAKGSVETVRGTVSTDWKFSAADSTFVLTVAIPFNSTAEVYIPAGAGPKLTIDEGSVRIWANGAATATQADSVRFVQKQNSAVVWKIGSGTYVFRAYYSSSTAINDLHTRIPGVTRISINGSAFSIKLDDISKEAAVSLYNVQGRLVCRWEHLSLLHAVSLNNRLSAHGRYIVKVTSGGWAITKQIEIIKR